MDLHSQWVVTLRRAGADRCGAAGEAGLAAQGRALIARYAEAHRHYHTLDHLVAVLSTVDELASYTDSPDLVRLAAWYHDAVYDPLRADNEERSAALAQAELGPAGLPAATVARVAALVRVTAGHRSGAGDRDAAVLCDADLAVLSRPAPGYDRYAAAVRQEYAHLDDGTWREGRAAVLRGLLKLPRLFGTAAGQSWESAARTNLSRELAALHAASGDAARRR